jgi:hypothetical protein
MGPARPISAGASNLRAAGGSGPSYAVHPNPTAVTAAIRSQWLGSGDSVPGAVMLACECPRWWLGSGDSAPGAVVPAWECARCWLGNGDSAPGAVMLACECAQWWFDNGDSAPGGSDAGM